MRRIAIICAFAMLLGIVMPCLAPIDADAAVTYPWSGWQRTNATYSGSTLTMNTLATVQRKSLNIPDDFTVNFSMCVSEWATGSYQGVYICNGNTRSGIYVFSDRFADFNGGSYPYKPDTGWHDYRLEVKNGKIGVYVDNKYMWTGTCEERSWDTQVYFFTSAATVPGSVQVKNFSITKPDGSDLSPLILTAPVETEYAPEFTTNWAKSTDGWTITDCDEIFVNDRGNIEIKVKDKKGYFQVERAPKTPANYDVEYGLQIHNFGSETIGLKVATNGYNNYHYISPDRIRGVSAETSSTGGYGILTDVGNEWHNWKFEVRGEFVTIYIDGGQVTRYRMPASAGQKSLIRVIVESVGNENCHLELGNIHYKPYFPEVSMKSPANGAEYTEGNSVTLKATASGADYVDFFVNGLNVGKGYAPNYEYVLKNVKLGTYRVSAGIGQKGDVENIITVNPKTPAKTPEGVNSEREYMLDYNFEESDGAVTVCDGYFRLNMKHTADSLTVDTKDGKELFRLGNGAYRVVTTSGYAMVYYNGHFANSFLMPRSEKVSVEHSGVTDFVKSGSGVKKLVFEDSWKNNSEYRRKIENIGHNYSVEFDKTDLSDETVVIYDGYYKADISMRNGKLYAVMQNTLGGEEEILLDDSVDAGYWRITVAKGLAQVWCDNVYKGSFAMTSNPRPAEFIRTMKNPTASTIVSVKNTDDLFYHQDDFEGNTELDSLDYWLPDGEGATATVENGEMKISGGTYLLNGQSGDVKVKWSAKIENASDFYVATRLFKNWYNLKIGYDFSGKKWYIKEWSDFKNFSCDTSTEFSGKEPSLGVWHDFELISKGSHIELFCDGVSVAKKENLNFPLNGYTGFGVNSGSVKIDNLEYEGRCAVTAAVKTATISDKVGIAEIWEDKTGAVYIQSGGHMVTKDGGETWSEYVKSRSAENRLRLNDGRLMELKFTDLKNPVEIWVSSNDGATWSRAGYMNEDDNQRRVVLTGSVIQAKNGRVFICADHGFSEYGTITKIATYYSDDLKNWHMSPSVNDSGVSGLNLQEGSHVELPDGTIRWYARSGLGFIMYCDSTDNGVTFDEWKPSQFIAPLCTYAVEQDNKDENTYWAVMQYDAVTYDYRYQHRPRNRFALMVSYDGMKSWEFVATLNEQSEFPSYDACNHVLRVFGDTVYIQWNNLDAPRRSITYAIDKSKVRSQKRFEEVHERYNWGESSGSMIDGICVVPKMSGMAKIYGENIQIGVNDEKYDAATIARIFGASSKVSGNTTTFSIGDGEVVFTEGSNAYSVNGVSKTSDSVCLSKGYFDINACADAFGKNISDMDDSFILWENEPATQSYLDEFADYAPNAGTVVEDMTGTMFGDKHLIFVQDYESNKSGATVEAAPGASSDYYDDILRVVDDGSGNKVLDITVSEGTAGHSLSLDGFATSQAIGSSAGFDINMKNGVVVTYDIMKKENGTAIGVEIADNDDGGRGVVLISPDSIPAMNKWYTVETRMADGRTPQVMVYDRETGIGKEVPCVTAGNIIGSGNFNRMRIVSDSRYSEFNNNITKESGKNAFTTHYLLDNVKLYNQTAKRTSGVILNKDYESQPRSVYEYDVRDAGVNNISDGYGEDENGKYYTIERTRNSSHTWVRYNLNGDIKVMPTDNYQVNVDVMKMAKSHSLSIQLCSTANNWDGWVIPANDVEVGVWYTYKFIEENGVKKAYRKVKGEDGFVEIAVVTDNPDNYEQPVVKSKALQISSGWKNYVMPAIESTQGQVGNDGLYGDADGIYATGVGSKWGIDNLIVAQLGAGEVEYFNEDDKLYNKLNVLFPDASMSEFMPVLAYYDSEGNIIGTDFAGNSYADFGKGESQMFTLYNGGTLFRKVKNEGGSVRAYFWTADGKPVAKEIDITDTF